MMTTDARELVAEYIASKNLGNMISVDTIMDTVERFTWPTGYAYTEQNSRAVLDYQVAQKLNALAEQQVTIVEAQAFRSTKRMRKALKKKLGH